MSAPPELTRTPVSTSAPDAKLSTSPSSVAQTVVQSVTSKLTKTITEAYSKVDKHDSETAQSKKTVPDELQIPQQISGQILRLDPSQPLYEDDSHVFVYFMLAMLICAVGYIVFHNKRKILALLIEGRQPHGEVRRSGGVNYKRLSTEPPGVSVA